MTVLRLLTVFAVGVMAAFAAPAKAECYGMNMLDTMPAPEKAMIRAAAEAVPYPSGNFWLAARDGVQMNIIGTYHLDDPRHAATVDHFGPIIATVSTLLVEGGPEEERALKELMAKDPSVMTITEGPTLLESLPAETWKRLSAAMAERGIPGFMAAKFQPWYVTVLLSMPPCALETMVEPKGLDGMLIDAAVAAGVPVRGLEPFDTVFTIFDTFSAAEQIDMIEQTLALEPEIVDFSVTLADAYFDGENRLMWELMRHQSYAMEGYTRAQVDAEMARMEDVLMVQRNRAWIPVIEKAAAEGPLVVAFGALHLSGQDGVLNLLAQNGWTITPLALP